jgi:hypothetical protein
MANKTDQYEDNRQDNINKHIEHKIDNIYQYNTKSVEEASWFSHRLYEG